MRKDFRVDAARVVEGFIIYTYIQEDDGNKSDEVCSLYKGLKKEHMIDATRWFMPVLYILSYAYKKHPRHFHHLSRVMMLVQNLNYIYFMLECAFQILKKNYLTYDKNLFYYFSTSLFLSKTMLIILI